MNQYVRPYNIVILRGYADYFRKKLKWPEERIEHLFARAGIDFQSLGSEDNWFSQEMADKFYNEAVKETRNNDLAFDVGKFSMQPEALGKLAWIGSSFLSPPLIFKQLSVLSKFFSKAASVSCIESGFDFAVLVAKTNEGFEERPYQCRNRMGIFKHVPSLFGVDAQIEHPECQFQGGRECRYVVRWDANYNSRTLWKYWAAALVSLFVFSIPMFSSVTNPAVFQWTGVAMLSSSITALFCRAFIFGRSSTKALESSLSTIVKKHDESELIRSLSNRFSRIGNLEGLYDQTAGLIKRMMEYDRVMLLSVEPQKMVLKVRSIVGTSIEMKEQLSAVEFNIREENKDGFLVNVVNSKSPLIVRDAQKRSDQLSKRSQKILMALGSNSFMAVPILFEDECLGVLAVDNELQEGNELTDNDLRLLESIANSLAITINNVKLLDSLNKELKRTKVLKSQEEMMKEWFKKFVSDDVVKNKSFLNQTLNTLEIRNLSVMFIDIVGFSKISEQLTPEDLAELLNSYIKLVNTVIVENGGSVNKIIGDGILAYFESADQCVEAGLEILAGLSVLNSDLRERIYQSIQLGIGAHFGTCLKGNIGCEERLDHTVIGDTINTAARLESKTREFKGRQLIISRALLDQCEKRYCVENLGSQKLKGKEHEVEIFAVLEEEPYLAKKVA